MLKFNSNPRNVVVVESFVDNLVTKYKLSPDKKGSILISLTEAVTNAIRHGNQFDEKKSVEVRHRKQKNCLAFRITDEGTGFDFDNVPDPTSPENLLKCGGRGVFLMRQLSDEIEFKNNGSTVEMRFDLC
ncbi:MAG TPA: ATP-binding protein [Saprospiraceae bacterium]|nr:ATP-binding protein [Saprospiraceae bacterium]